MKDAEKFMPETPWHEGAYDFTYFADDVKTWVSQLAPEMDAEDFRRWVNRKDPEELSNKMLVEDKEFPLAASISKKLHAVLLKKTKGLAAWRQLVIDFAPKSTNDASALMTTIIQPRRAKTLDDFRSRKVEWEKKVKDYEADFEEIPAPVKEAALKAMIPEELLQSRFRGKDCQ